MNVHEAMKLATPGPLVVCNAYTHPKLIGADRFLCANIERSSGDPMTDSARARRELADAALLKHWYDRGPKLLEALKRTREKLAQARATQAIPSRSGIWEDEVDTLIDEGHRIIAECEEVEGI